MKHYKVEIIDDLLISQLKRLGKDTSDISKIKPLTQECFVESVKEVKRIYGLDEPDVHYYKITEIS